MGDPPSPGANRRQAEDEPSHSAQVGRQDRPSPACIDDNHTVGREEARKQGILIEVLLSKPRPVCVE
ncbi:BZ3500_MvSof-1268-A1-R1_Chr7-2g09520 [Microbotryum saponariae]|uniref:BZ3500_MvSof-1268-A1-R1_Chr7-2g09520 protein n=1 Tax=Microbotryum saponariae TaxID=289078 RepID=A0A2X0LTK0_9BASI|nr:BZ3501_MvSof-1269-A2-R1_Chr7-1g09220 [Microbotryum saponariae]SDA02623.1 BZ3500_MvSof-1268-A1-R1_Chr7-2g09520 [Microbotryum saponariae]